MNEFMRKSLNTARSAGEVLAPFAVVAALGSPVAAHADAARPVPHTVRHESLEPGDTEAVKLIANGAQRFICSEDQRRKGFQVYTVISNQVAELHIGNWVEPGSHQRFNVDICGLDDQLVRVVQVDVTAR